MDFFTKYDAFTKYAYHVSIIPNWYRYVSTIVSEKLSVSISLLIIQYDYCFGQQLERSSASDESHSPPF